MKPGSNIVSDHFADVRKMIGYDTAILLKIPNWFKIDIPIGHYNPNWAIVVKGEKI